MRIVIQRVSHASVAIPRNADVSVQIERGLLALIGLQRGDTDQTVQMAVEKLVNLRIFPDEQGKMNRCLLELQKPQALLVPNFTVACVLGKGRRPSFDAAMPPDQAALLFRSFVEKFAEKNIITQSGVFGAEMQVSLCNDGPVTFILDIESQ